MSSPLDALWRTNGAISRRTYVVLGLILFFVKYNLDRLLHWFATGNAWSFLAYLRPGSVLGRFGAAEPWELVAYAVVSLPFIWAGVELTLRRLRSAGLPPWPVLLFFVPAVNLLLFALLAVLPEEGERAADESPERDATSPERDATWPERGATWIGRIVPRSASGSAAFAILITVPVTAVLAYHAAAVLGDYGWGLFLGLPFFLGFGSVVIYEYHEPRSVKSSIGVAVLSVLILGALLFAIAIEGLICLGMALPIAAPLAAFGGFVADLVMRRPVRTRGESTFASLALAVAAVIGIEHGAPAEPTLFEVRSEVVIDAPPEAVWNEVVAFSQIPPPTEWLFRAGVAHPIRAEIDGRGPGAVRRCVFSTGAFVEPIEVWDEPRRLEFSVAAQPPPLLELTPYTGVQPPHVDGYFVSKRGRFLLEPLPGGRTRLEGTTWYSHGLWPETYWRLWSDRILHAIHMRVLEHIATRAEGG